MHDWILTHRSLKAFSCKCVSVAHRASLDQYKAKQLCWQGICTLYSGVSLLTLHWHHSASTEITHLALTEEGDLSMSNTLLLTPAEKRREKASQNKDWFMKTSNTSTDDANVLMCLAILRYRRSTADSAAAPAYDHNIMIETLASLRLAVCAENSHQPNETASSKETTVSSWHSSWHHDIHHDIMTFIMTSWHSSWHHDINDTAWHVVLYWAPVLLSSIFQVGKLRFCTCEN